MLETQNISVLEGMPKNLPKTLKQDFYSKLDQFMLFQNKISPILSGANLAGSILVHDGGKMVDVLA